MDFFAPVPANDALDKAQDFLATRWPYGGRIVRNGNAVIWTARDTAMQTLLFYLTASIVSPRPKTAQFIASNADGGCKLAVAADVAEHKQVASEWAERELGATRVVTEEASQV